MTNGIIQEVFKKYLKEYHSLPEHDIGILHRKIVTRIEQELIEKIEQEFNPKDGLRYTAYDVEQKLIGDNQE